MGSPDVLSSVGHDFPSLVAGLTCPRGPGAAGPGLQGSSAGKARENCRPGTRSPPFFGGLALRGVAD